jgi:hypothetical protein
MPAIACVKCGMFLRVKKQGVGVEEGMIGSRLGEDNAEGWGPYKLWMADLCECPKCHIQVVCGFGRNRIAEHYEPDYLEIRKRYPPIVRVNDCGGLKP